MSLTKKWMVLAVTLLGTGILVSMISFAILGFDPHRLENVEYETNTYKVDEDFQDITIKADIEDIIFASSDDGECKVVCREETDDLHQVNVKGEALTVERKGNGKQWYLRFGIAVETPEIVIYLPRDSYRTLSIGSDAGDINIPENFNFADMTMVLDTGYVKCHADATGNVNIRTDTGEIFVSGVKAADMKLESDTGEMDVVNVDCSGDMEIRESTGSVTMKNVTCRNFISKGDTGEFNMTNVIAKEEYKIENDTGNVKFNGCDAENIYVKMDTGSVTGTLLSEKKFITDTDVGRVDVPKTSSGGRCEITTDTGDIRIKIR